MQIPDDKAILDKDAKFIGINTEYVDCKEAYKEKTMLIRSRHISY